MSLPARRVVITGAGCISAIGNTVAEFAASLFAGRTGIAAEQLAPGQKLNFSGVARVRDFSPAGLLESSALLLTERSSQFALAAAKQAVEESQVLAHCPPENMAVLMGCSAGGQEAEEAELVKLYTNTGRIHPFTVPRVMANAGAGQISMRYGITGPVLTYATACASSGHAIGQAFHMIRHGQVDAALAGGHEAALTYGFLKSWEAMRVVSTAGCRPFSRERDGMTLGEGAAVLVLEEREQALRRGAAVYGEICGFGMSSDAFHTTQPRPAGQAAAIRAALRDGNCAAEEITYVNAHGTGTVANDRAEADSLYEVFGERAAGIPISSTKPLHGHAIGAGAALEALATLLALRHRRLPPSAGADPVDDSLGLNVVLSSESFAPAAALSNSFAFGGLNASLLFRAV